MKTKKKNLGSYPNDARKLFWKLGTCSRTLFHIVNRELGSDKELEELASNSLAGGIFQEGEQCGMLWGASLAVGTEAYKRCDTQEQAIAVAIKATQSIMASFEEREKTINCKDITRCNFNNKWSFAKYMVSGRFLYCFKLVEQWAPEAVEIAIKELSEEQLHQYHNSMSCATEVVRRMGGTDEEMIMVAGFAGGLGLSGGGCGVLSAAIWMKSLKWYRENDKKMVIKTPYAKQTLEAFYKATNGKISCSEIINKQFKNIEDHTNFVKNNGCSELIKALVES